MLPALPGLDHARVAHSHGAKLESKCRRADKASASHTSEACTASFKITVDSTHKSQLTLCKCCSNVWNTQRVINTGCSMEAVSRSSPMSTPFRMSTPREFLHTETPSHSSSFLRNEGVAALRVHARPSLRSTSRCRWCWTPISTASGSTRPTLHRTSAPTLHRRASPSLSRPTPPPSSWLLPQRRTHLQLSRSGANWVLIRLFLLPSSHAALPPWIWQRPTLSPPARYSPIFNLGWALLPLLSRPSWLTALSTLLKAMIPPGLRRPRRRLCHYKGVRLTAGLRLRSGVSSLRGPPIL